jgi:hypothetical protein
MSTTRKKTPMKPVNATLITTGKGSQASSENTAIGASDSALVDDNSNLPTHTPIARSMKSLQVIFPSTSQTKYEDMFLLEKIAFIYIELVVKRGHKSMTNWPFRNLAR